MPCSPHRSCQGTGERSRTDLRHGLAEQGEDLAGESETVAVAEVHGGGVSGGNELKPGAAVGVYFSLKLGLPSRSKQGRIDHTSHVINSPHSGYGVAPRPQVINRRRPPVARTCHSRFCTCNGERCAHAPFQCSKEGLRRHADATVVGRFVCPGRASNQHDRPPLPGPTAVAATHEGLSVRHRPWTSRAAWPNWITQRLAVRTTYYCGVFCRAGAALNGACDTGDTTCYGVNLSLRIHRTACYVVFRLLTTTSMGAPAALGSLFV